MNLHCDKLDLRQTPTWISNICMMTDDGPSFELKGKDAKRALRCYIMWVSSFNRTSWKSEEQAAVDDERAATQYHVQEVIDIINDPDLTISIM